MTAALSDLESRLTMAFDDQAWDLDLADLTDQGYVEESWVRPINMDVRPLFGSRPRT